MDVTSDTHIDQRNAELVLRDYHLGLLAQVTEYAHRTKVAHERLEVEMTRAYNAETRAYNAERDLLQVHQQLIAINSLRQQILDLQSSTTWKIGRFIMLPVRILRRLFTNG